MIRRRKRSSPTRKKPASVPKTEAELRLLLVKREMNKAKSGARMARLCNAILDLKVPIPEFEYPFFGPKGPKERPWRFDLAYPTIKLAIEVDGSTFAGGRHSRGDGDRIKYACAAAYGWRVMPFSTVQIDRQLSDVAETIKAGYFYG